jgi:hypothetical protein
MVAGFRQRAAAFCVACGAVLATTQAGHAQFFINEIFFNVGGGGDDLRDEYIELRGTAGASLDNHYLLILENELPGADTTNRAGVVERIFDLNTRSMGTNGFLTLRQKNSRYKVAPGTTDLVNTGTGAGYGNGATSSIGAWSNGDNDLEGGGFTAMLIRNDTGVAPTLNLDLDSLVDNDNDPLTEKDGLDYPGMGQPGWTILDSIGIFAEPEETETGRLYGKVNYARWDNLIPNDFVPQIEPGTEFQKIEFEIEYAGRWGNSTGHAVDDWHISNFTDNLGSGSLLGVTNPNGPDWRQSCISGPGCHAANDFNPNTPAPQPANGTESNQAVPYGTKLANTLGAANFMFGDYNQDGVVDAADYTVWRDTVGTAGTESNHPAADTNHDFLVNDLDYNIWKSNFGQSGGSAPGGAAMGVAGVPEPTAGVLLAMGVVLAGLLPRGKA